MKKKYFSLLFIVTIIASCGEIRKEVATDQLLGIYFGKATFTYHHSLHNIGLQDEQKISEGTISIYKNSLGEMFVKTGDGNLRLTGLTLAENGTLFSIPMQTVVQENGSVSEFQGLQTTELEGVKYDGMYYSQSNYLIFAYQTNINYNYWGQTAEVLVSCVYEFHKR